MKYFLIVAVVMVAFWLWRMNRIAAHRARQDQQRSKESATTSLQTTEIVACGFCSVHLPRAEALPGGKGVYCSDAHRRQAEG